ncbi:MAG: cytochrome c biogenesis protein CcdA [bacterium]
MKTPDAKRSRKSSHAASPTTWVWAGLAAVVAIGTPASAQAAAGPVAAGAAFLGGLLTALTPCVYPIIPLAVGFMGSWGHVGRRRAALLSGAYVLGMGSVFTSLGVAAGLSHSLFGSWSASATFQLLAAALLWFFAAGMLGVYAFRLPQSLTRWASRAGGPGPLGAVAAGAASGFLAAGCTGPVLGGILTYIGATQDLWSAALIMMSFSAGLGLPFFLLGTALPALPRPGRWLLWTEGAVGVLLLATGAYFAAQALHRMGARLEPEWLSVGVTLAVGGLGAWLWAAKTRRIPGRPAWARLVVLLMAGGMTLAATGLLASESAHSIAWVQVKSEPEFDRALRGSADGKPVIVDFHADWCPDCRVMESTVFADHALAGELREHFVTVRVDATDDTDAVTPVARRFGVPGLPAVRFFSADGTERQDLRIDGPFHKERFLEHLNRLRATSVAKRSVTK